MRDAPAVAAHPVTATTGSAPSAPSASRGPHWIVGVHYGMRTASFAYAFLFFAAFAWHRISDPIFWVLLVLQFLVYPHLVYWRARRAVDSRAVELNNLLLDTGLLGIWCGALGLPPSITATVFITSGVNNVMSAGRPGMLQAIGAFGAGILGASVPAGWPTLIDEGPLVQALCFIGLSGYLLAIGQVAFNRARSLRRAREALQASEAALRSANAELGAQLAQIRDLQGQLEFQAYRDPLTGLFNRRHFLEMARHALSRCGRERRPLSLLVLDVDHFKSINDRYGHQAGDEVLKVMADLLGASVREADVPCRYGGEEFVVLLPDVGGDVARYRAEQLRNAFGLAQVDSAQGRVGTTVSIGVATFPEHGTDIDTLLHHADMALYAAKRGGRDQTVVYSAELGASGQRATD